MRLSGVEMTGCVVHHASIVSHGITRYTRKSNLLRSSHNCDPRSRGRGHEVLSRETI